ncbi:MAG: hypothetical protein LKI53_04410 [Bacteroidales bacterium]|jgi:hypothetical protein|nr:hypothetical protein [Bacteroidales bacterium]
MNYDNKKMITYGTIIVAVLVALIVFLFFKISGKSDSSDAGTKVSSVAFKAIPIDAVAVMDFSELKNLDFFIEAPSCPVSQIRDRSNPLPSYIKKAAAYFPASGVRSLISIHYSAKNDVSLLSVIDLSGLSSGRKAAEKFILSMNAGNFDYNGIQIHTSGDSLNVSCYRNFLLASTSLFVLENSLRHLKNGRSILDNKEFAELQSVSPAGDKIFINHRQIGKLFSGIVSRKYLGYSTFFRRLSDWSMFSLNVSVDHIGMDGSFENRSEASLYSSVFSGQEPASPDYGNMLPGNTVFAISYTIGDLHKYEVKRNTFFNIYHNSYFRQDENGKGRISPGAWLDSLKTEEVVAACYMKGGKPVWVNMVRKHDHFGIKSVVSAVSGKDEISDMKKFAFGGCLEKIFGKFFGYCTETDYLEKDGWIVIGPKTSIAGFVRDVSDRYTLADYIEQTPAEDAFKREGSVSIFFNMKTGIDSLMPVFKPEYGELLNRTAGRNNFSTFLINVSSDGNRILAHLDFFTANLDPVPAPKPGRSSEERTFVSDSIVSVPAGPFKVRNFVRGGYNYLEQLSGNKLRLLDARKRSLWTIPFSGKICGMVPQIDFYHNNKLQMLLISGNRLFLIDRLGRFVRGFPVRLKKEVLLGPKIAGSGNGEDFSFFVLNRDNSLSWYDISGKAKAGFRDITVPENVYSLPEPVRIGDVEIILLRTSVQLRIYDLNGTELTGRMKNKIINPDCSPEKLSGDWARVKCTDGKTYAFNLLTGKLKRL